MQAKYSIIFPTLILTMILLSSMQVFEINALCSTAIKVDNLTVTAYVVAVHVMLLCTKVVVYFEL